MLLDTHTVHMINEFKSRYVVWSPRVYMKVATHMVCKAHASWLSMA